MTSEEYIKVGIAIGSLLGSGELVTAYAAPTYCIHSNEEAPILASSGDIPQAALYNTQLVNLHLMALGNVRVHAGRCSTCGKIYYTDPHIKG